MNSDYEKLLKCTEIVKSKIGDFKPKIALVLGSGLGDYGERVDAKIIVNYSDIDGFPKSTVEGHAGRFIFGYIEGVEVVVMQGRIHYYEGYSMQDVVLPTRLLGLLGVEVYFVTNGSGALNRSYKPGDIMLIRDHLSLFIPSPLIGENFDELGPRFPDMTHVYSKRLGDMIKDTAKEVEVDLKEGVYVMLTGPQYETPEEVLLLEKLGADCVGMSTVNEAIVARHMGMEVCGISWAANLASGLTTDLQEHNMTNTLSEGYAKLVSASIKKIANELEF